MGMCPKVFGTHFVSVFGPDFCPLSLQKWWFPDWALANKIVPNQKKKNPKLLRLQKYRYSRPNPLLRDDGEKEEMGLSPFLYPA
jgi:hypothetical protein